MILVKYKNRGIYDRTTNSRVNSTEIYDHIRHGGEVEAESTVNLKQTFLVKLMKLEPPKGDLNLLNRIIKNGGLSEYINKLENQSS